MNTDTLTMLTGGSAASRAAPPGAGTPPADLAGFTALLMGMVPGAVPPAVLPAPGLPSSVAANGTTVPGTTGARGVPTASAPTQTSDPAVELPSDLLASLLSTLSLGPQPVAIDGRRSPAAEPELLPGDAETPTSLADLTAQLAAGTASFLVFGQGQLPPVVPPFQPTAAPAASQGQRTATPPVAVPSPATAPLAASPLRTAEAMPAGMPVPPVASTGPAPAATVPSEASPLPAAMQQLLGQMTPVAEGEMPSLPAMTLPTPGMPVRPIAAEPIAAPIAGVPIAGDMPQLPPTAPNAAAPVATAAAPVTTESPAAPSVAAATSPMVDPGRPLPAGAVPVTAEQRAPAALPASGSAVPTPTPWAPMASPSETAPIPTLPATPEPTLQVAAPVMAEPAPLPGQPNETAAPKPAMASPSVPMAPVTSAEPLPTAPLAMAPTESPPMPAEASTAPAVAASTVLATPAAQSTAAQMAPSPQPKPPAPSAMGEAKPERRAAGTGQPSTVELTTEPTGHGEPVIPAETATAGADHDPGRPDRQPDAQGQAQPPAPLAANGPSPGAPSFVIAEETATAPPSIEPAAARAATPEQLAGNRAYPGEPPAPVLQVSSAVARAASGPVERVHVMLEPKELGSIEITISTGESDQARAVIRVEKPETLDLLQRDQRQLERLIGNAGLKLESGGLDLGLQRDQGQGTAFAQQQQQQPSRQGLRSPFLPDVEPIRAEPPRPARPGLKLLDVLI